MKRFREEDNIQEKPWHTGCKGSKRHSTLKKSSMEFLQSVKLFSGSGLFDKLLTTLRDYRARKINASSVTAQVKGILGDYPVLISGFNQFLPEPYRISCDDEETESETEEGEKVKYEEAALRFIRKVKSRFKKSDPEVYGFFLDLIWPPHEKMVIGVEDWEKVSRILNESNHLDLLKDFERLITYSNEEDDRDVNVDGDGDFKSELELLDEVERVLSDSEYLELLTKLYDHIDGKITREQLQLQAEVTDRNLIDALDTLIDFVNKHYSEFKSETKGEKLGLPTCRQISRSYWLLRKRSRPPGRSPVSIIPTNRVLNDELINRGDKSGYSSIRQISESEEKMFEWEDERYERDMLMGYVNSSIENVKRLMEGNGEGIEVKDHIFSRRCIERMYGEYGADMLHYVEEQPVKALPVILGRLEEKKLEIQISVDEFEKSTKVLMKKLNMDSTSDR